MKKSFTLIELLIVIVIIGVIASLAMPQYQKLTRKAQATEAKQVLSAIIDSAWRYYLQAGNMTRSILDLDLPIPTSKYFDYDFRYMSEQGGVIAFARYKNYAALPVGSIAGYLVTIQDFSSAPLPPAQASQHLSGNWYKFYQREILDAAGALNQEYGWD